LKEPLPIATYALPLIAKIAITRPLKSDASTGADNVIDNIATNEIKNFFDLIPTLYKNSMRSNISFSNSNN